MNNDEAKKKNVFCPFCRMRSLSKRGKAILMIFFFLLIAVQAALFIYTN